MLRFRGKKPPNGTCSGDLRALVHRHDDRNGTYVEVKNVSGDVPLEAKVEPAGCCLGVGLKGEVLNVYLCANEAVGLEISISISIRSRRAVSGATRVSRWGRISVSAISMIFVAALVHLVSLGL
jgi:hypothetical protein